MTNETKTLTVENIIVSRRAASTYTDDEIRVLAGGIEHYEPRMLDHDSQVWWSLNYGEYMSRVKKLTPICKTTSSSIPVTIIRCKKCGDTNIAGAMFTTLPSECICDDCV